MDQRATGYKKTGRIRKDAARFHLKLSDELSGGEGPRSFIVPVVDVVSGSFFILLVGAGRPDRGYRGAWIFGIRVEIVQRLPPRILGDLFEVLRSRLAVASLSGRSQQSDCVLAAFGVSRIVIDRIILAGLFSGRDRDDGTLLESLLCEL